MKPLLEKEKGIKKQIADYEAQKADMVVRILSRSVGCKH